MSHRFIDEHDNVLFVTQKGEKCDVLTLTTICDDSPICDFFALPTQAVEIALAILAEAAPVLAAKVKAVDALIAAAWELNNQAQSIPDDLELPKLDAALDRIYKILSAIQSAGVEVDHGD